MKIKQYEWKDSPFYFRRIVFPLTQLFSNAANNFKLLLKKRNKCSKRRKRWFWNLMYPISWSICNIPQRLVKTCNVPVLQGRPLDISLIFNQRCVYNANDIPTRFFQLIWDLKSVVLFLFPFTAKQYHTFIISNNIPQFDMYLDLLN